MPQPWGCGYLVIIVLLKLRRKLDMCAFRVGKAQEQVIPCTMTTRRPENRRLLTAQIIGPDQQLLTCGNTIANMIDIRLPFHNNESVVITVAAEPDAFTQ